jgi:hypothetical protein
VLDTDCKEVALGTMSATSLAGDIKYLLRSQLVNGCFCQ